MTNLFAAIYEFFYFRDPFSPTMFDKGIYGLVGLSLIITTAALAIVFYYFINRPKFSRWYHWLIILIVTFVLNLLLGYWIPESQLAAAGFQFTSLTILTFGFWNAVISSFLYLIISFIIRWWSIHAKGTPIPN